MSSEKNCDWPYATHAATRELQTMSALAPEADDHFSFPNDSPLREEIPGHLPRRNHSILYTIKNKRAQIIYLNTRVILMPVSPIVVVLPVRAGLLQRVLVKRDLLGRLDELDCQSLRHVPRDMAMHQPRAWVDEEVVAVEVDGVRDRRGAAVLLDQPVVPLALVGGVVDVHAGLVVVVVVGEVLQRRLLPVDVHGRVAERPDKERVAAGRELGLRDADVEAALGVVESAGGNGLDPVWCGLAWLLAVARLRVTAGGRLARRSVAVAPDGFGVEVVCAKAVGRHVRTEPVVARSLVGLDDNVVTLTNTDENRLYVERLDRDEIGGHDSHVVAIKGDSDVVVNRGVNETQAVLLALLHRHLVVLSTTVGVLVRAVDEDRVSWRRRSLRLEVDCCQGIDLVCSRVIPVANDIWTQIIIVIRRGRSVKYHGANDAVAIL
ncbi:putative multicopper oxidase, type 1 [Hortaea werneckii]|nr:putative multicopper oxidase, type 1 [Hortaea werneckii]